MMIVMQKSENYYYYNYRWYEGEFDLSATLPLVETEGSADTYDQNSFTSSVPQRHPLSDSARQASEHEFHSLPTTSISLSALRAVYMGEDKVAAMRLLNKKHQITIDPVHQISPPGLATFSIPSHSLDFLLLVPRSPGIDVLRPPRGSRHSPDWGFELDLSRPRKQLSVKHGMLGFHVEGSALYCGRVGKDMMYLCMVDKETFNSPTPSAPTGHVSTAPTNLSRRNLRIYQSWLLYGLSEAGVGGVTCDAGDYYSIDLDSPTPNWAFTVGFKYVHHIVVE